MHHRLTYRIIFIYLTLALFTAACGSLQLALETEEVRPGPNTSGEESDQPSIEVLVVRDTALAFVRHSYGELAPPEGMTWSWETTSPEGLVGVSSYLFSAQGWTVSIEYPVVAPEAALYTVVITAQDGGFRWQGQVNAQGGVSEISHETMEFRVVGWLGHIASLPEGMDEDDVFILQPGGLGELGLEGADASLESEIQNLRDATGANEFVHAWGKLRCKGAGGEDCTLRAERLQYGPVVSQPEPIDGWEGVIYEGPPEPGSGGDDYFALVGPFPMQFGIWAMDEGLLAELASLRDTGAVVRIFGQIRVGVPDWNGTQIQVERYERVVDYTGEVPAAPSWEVPDRGWVTYENARYRYKIEYPPEATLEEAGIHGYTSDENGMPIGGLPEGVTLNTYFQYLEETYGLNLCVQITYTLGYITISAPENAGFRYANCGRTGVGVAEITSFEEKLVIDGQAVTARGMEVRAGGETLDQHNETLVVTLADGTRIEYGSRPVSNGTYQDYLMKGKPVLLEILGTYTSIP